MWHTSCTNSGYGNREKMERIKVVPPLHPARDISAGRDGVRLLRRCRRGPGGNVINPRPPASPEPGGTQHPQQLGNRMQEV